MPYIAATIYEQDWDKNPKRSVLLSMKPLKGLIITQKIGEFYYLMERVEVIGTSGVYLNTSKCSCYEKYYKALKAFEEIVEQNNADS